MRRDAAHPLRDQGEPQLRPGLRAPGVWLTGPSVPDSLDVLIARLGAIEADLHAAVVAHRGEIDAVAPEHRVGATNLVHYTALRQRDLRDLQNDLMDLGATSLATAEANVLAKVQAARNVLTALRGDPGP